MKNDTKQSTIFIMYNSIYYRQGNVIFKGVTFIGQTTDTIFIPNTNYNRK